MFSSSSSLGKKGAKSSSGGLDKVPSGLRLAELFGSHTCTVSVNTSQIIGSVAISTSSIFSTSSLPFLIGIYL